VFSECTARRTAEIADLRSGWHRRAAGPAVPRICVVTRSAFRLWDDAGETLYRVLSGSTEARWQRFDPDQPAACSPLALARAAVGSDAITAADIGRADLPAGLTPQELPWLTWSSAGHIPSFSGAGPHDQLLLGDPRWHADALAAGWPAERLAIGGWPKRATTDPTAARRSLAIIADTCLTEPPEAVTEYSSHTLLWEKIQHLIARDPFCVPDDPTAWTRSLAGDAGIDSSTLNVPLFVTRLILPAHAQALAGVLIAAGLPVHLYGDGWDQFPQFAAHARGTVTSREALHAAADAAVALVNVWPTATSHAIDSLGRPVLRRSGHRREAFLRDARALLDTVSPRVSPTSCAPALSAEILLRRLTATA
jgi:hypothetical protein